uniref:F-box domain-containing protein n=1 Tax=Heterorhabditis bacteriophora TaxID=37862 RepID=A0A1I7XEV4_HETBA
MQATTSFNDLPIEMNEAILERLHAGCYKNARKVCRLWAELVDKIRIKIKWVFKSFLFNLLTFDHEWYYIM